MKADLHLHSTASDGRLIPAELVRSAAEMGLNVIALTDHDSVEGVASALAAAKNFPSLEVIPGVELSTDVPQGEVHILGYFIDLDNLELMEALDRFRNSRRIRARKMIAKLNSLGVAVDEERVQELAGDGAVGRPHIAQVMLERGYVSSLREAFGRYIGRKSCAYVEREKMTPAEAVGLVVRGGGLPVLAHPANLDHLEELIPELQKAGLVGLEVYYGGYTSTVVRHLASLGRKYGLIATGGSDYHGLEGGGGTQLGGVDIPPDCVERLLALARRRQCCNVFS